MICLYCYIKFICKFYVFILHFIFIYNAQTFTKISSYIHISTTHTHMWFIWFLFPIKTQIVFYNGHDFIRGLWSWGASEFMQLLGKGNSWHFILTVFSNLNQNPLFNMSWAMFQCAMPDICQNWGEKICFSQIIPCNFLYLPKGHIKEREKCP